jgi:riboflavin kinase/FMN adenylyltransferase
VFYPAISNLGGNPTFSNSAQPVKLESHLLMKPEAWPETDAVVRLEFLKFIRPEIAFASATLLSEQIGQDVAQAKAFFNV